MQDSIWLVNTWINNKLDTAHTPTEYNILAFSLGMISSKLYLFFLVTKDLILYYN